MFKLVKKLPLNYNSICFYKGKYYLLKNNILDIYDVHFKKSNSLTLDNNYNYLTCDNDYIYLANDNEIYKYNLLELVKLKLDIDVKIKNIKYVDYIGLIIITSNILYIYDNNCIKPYLNFTCSSLFWYFDEMFFIQKNKLFNLNKYVQNLDINVIDCLYNDNLIILSDCIYIYRFCYCEELEKLLKCLCNKTTIADSIAFCEKSLACILSCEAQKLKKAIMLSNNIDELLKINESINKTIKNITMLEQILCYKLELYNSQCHNTDNNSNC